MTRVLITGFEPFGGELLNPSLEALGRLSAVGAGGVEVAGAVLPVAFGRAFDVLRAAIEQRRPSAVICLGE
ncbi:MAG TPA: peptidase C15, partial [Polyangiaceae bacterium]|nr:peptidase C15 [Polyangiaceae bacterium]